MRSQIFISYSHQDSEWLNQLQVFLKPLERSGTVVPWDDTKIRAGQKWNDEIKAALDAAKVAVLLVSADFLASDFIANDELPSLLEAANKEGTLILSVIISPCILPPNISQFQTVNDPRKPLVDLSKGDRDRVWVKLVESIEKALAPAPTVASVNSQPVANKINTAATTQPAQTEADDSSEPEESDASEADQTLSVGEGLELKNVRAGDLALVKGDDPASLAKGIRKAELAKNAKIEGSEIGDIVGFKQTGKQGTKK